MGNKPYLQLYPGDWLREPGTRAMSCAAVGAYVNLLMFLDGTPKRGQLRARSDYIRRLTGAEKSEWSDIFFEWRKARILDFVTHCNGEVTVKNRRMVREEKERKSNLNRQLRYRKVHKQESNGNGNADVQENNAVSSSSSSISSSLRVKKSARFDRFWKACPKKKSKGQAERAFLKLNPDEQLLATMIASIERAKKSEDWIKEGGQYIPYPATWLNARGWEDEEIMRRAPEDRLTKARVMVDEIIEKHNIPRRVGDAVVHLAGVYARWPINLANLTQWCWELRELDEQQVAQVMKAVIDGPKGEVQYREPSMRILADKAKAFRRSQI